MTPSLYKATARDFTFAPYVTSLRYSAGMLKCPFSSEEGERKIKLHKLRRNGKISKERIYIMTSTKRDVLKYTSMVKMKY